MSLDRKLLDNFLPEGFETQNLDGYKENFDADRIRTGFDKDTLEILSGPNLNNFLDKTGKNFNVLQEVMQFLKDMPIGCFPFINASNQLDYKNISSFFRNVGEIVYSSVPLDDDNLHLADGSIIEGNGKYRRFVKYMVDLMNDYPSLFVTNEVYNTTVNKYGVCGKYVYNAQANTLRLPTYTGIMEATLDSSSLGNVVEAGLPNITGYFYGDDYGPNSYGAFNTQYGVGEHGLEVSGYGNSTVSFDASRSNPAYGRLQPGAKNQVQPQTVKVYPYVVLSIDESQKQQLTAVYVYQGSVPTKDDLPKEGNVLGHVYNVEYDGFMYGQNYAWNGEDWDPLGGIVDLSKYFTKIEVSNQFATKLSLESNVEFLQGQISQNRADINTLDAGGVISKTPSKLKAATLLATVMDKPQSDIEIFNILMDKKRSTFDLSKFTVVGSPTITDDGIVNGFSDNNFIQFNSNIDASSKNYEIVIPFKIDEGKNSTVIIANNRINVGVQGLACIILKYSMLCYIGTTSTEREWTVAKQSTKAPFKSNVNYLLKIKRTPTQYIYSIYDYANNLIDTVILDEVGDIRAGLDSLKLGVTAFWSNLGYTSSYDLRKLYATQDNKEVFNGNKTGIDTIKADNYEVVGSPVISNDGVLSNCTYNADYVSSKQTFNLYNANTWEIQCHYNPMGLSNEPEFFMFYSPTIKSNGLHLGYKTKSTLQLTVFEDGNKLVLTNPNISLNWESYTDYLFKVRFTGTQYLLDYSKDNGNTWIKLLTVNSNKKTVSSPVYVRNGIYGGTGIDYGIKIGITDLNKTKVYIDRNLVYQPCLKIPYTQSKTGSKIVDGVYRDRVWDMNEQFGYTHYYTLGDEPTIPNAYTLPTVSNETIVDMYESENGTWEQRADLTLRQRGISCTSGTPVTLLKEFRDDKYSLSIGYSSKSASSFTPSASGDWFAEGKVYLQ